MFIRPKSTRRTKIGTLQRATIYDLDESVQAVHDVLFEKKPKGAFALRPVYEKMSAAAVKKAKAAVESLVPPDRPADPESAKLKAEIAAQAELIEDLQAEIDRRDAAMQEAGVALPPLPDDDHDEDTDGDGRNDTVKAEA